MARVLPLKQRDPGSMPGEPTKTVYPDLCIISGRLEPTCRKYIPLIFITVLLTIILVLWCNGSTLNESDPVKDTFSTKFQSTHKGEDGVRFPGELPFNAAVV